MTQALDAVSSAGEPLLGATVRLQLHGSGLENAIAQLQVRFGFVSAEFTKPILDIFSEFRKHS
jgi:hypothetical protein